MQFSGHMSRAKDGQRLQLQSNLELTGSSCILPTRLSLKPLACATDFQRRKNIFSPEKVPFLAT